MRWVGCGLGSGSASPTGREGTGRRSIGGEGVRKEGRYTKGGGRVMWVGGWECGNGGIVSTRNGDRAGAGKAECWAGGHGRAHARRAPAARAVRGDSKGSRGGRWVLVGGGWGRIVWSRRQRCCLCVPSLLGERRTHVCVGRKGQSRAGQRRRRACVYMCREAPARRGGLSWRRARRGNAPAAASAAGATGAQARLRLRGS